MKKYLLAAAAVIAMSAPALAADWTVGGFVGATQGQGSSYGGSQGYAGTGYIGNAYSTATSSGVGKAESGYTAGMNGGNYTFSGNSSVFTGSMANTQASSAGNGFTAGAAGNNSWAGTSLQGYGGAGAIGAHN